ncbi:hypothetical protein E2C01_092598 [Portunus trituberculatus]|uniref:Uncharacterized protein n=1 Tax=Portunus trituberculatus TaxID=210409 RepID=A0A5B7JS66_PORTR|nr:hypothetical protein [Portunus trituberculatus]
MSVLGGAPTVYTVHLHLTSSVSPSVTLHSAATRPCRHSLTRLCATLAYLSLIRFETETLTLNFTGLHHHHATTTTTTPRPATQRSRDCTFVV